MKWWKVLFLDNSTWEKHSGYVFFLTKWSCQEREPFIISNAILFHKNIAQYLNTNFVQTAMHNRLRYQYEQTIIIITRCYGHLPTERTTIINNWPLVQKWVDYISDYKSCWRETWQLRPEVEIFRWSREIIKSMLRRYTCLDHTCSCNKC